MDQTLLDRLTAWRHHLHAHPEVSLAESETAAFVCARLAELGVPFAAGIGGHGVVATLARPLPGGGNAGPRVGLRADMDALPIAETTGLPYASSQPGVMHACGHDGHTTALLGAVALLAADPDWAGTVHCIFQPAEEGFGGARAMLADGLLDRFPMERIFAFHNWPGLAAGTVAVHDGPVMAGPARLEITLEGQAGHAAMPHLARDPVLAAAHLLLALQSVVAREIDPLDPVVLSICTIEGGEAVNQIPSRSVMRGTFRTCRPAVRDRVEASIRRISEGIAQTFGMRAEARIRHGVATINTHGEAGLAAMAAQAAGLGVRRDLAPSMAGEDFGSYLEHVPGAFVWIGNGTSAELHHPAYDFNDAILPAASGWLAAVARQALKADPADAA